MRVFLFISLVLLFAVCYSSPFHLCISFVSTANGAIPTDWEAWWPMNGNADDTTGVYDGTKHTLTTVANRHAVSGKALEWGGIISWMNVPTIEASMDSSFTLCLWVNPDDGQPSSNESLMGYSCALAANICKVELTTAGKLEATYKANGTSNVTTTRDAQFSDGANGWKFLVFAFDTLVDSIGIFVDASQVSASYTGTGLTSIDFTTFDCNNDFFFGATNVGFPEKYYDGKQDDARLYERILTGSEISALNDE